MSLCARTFHIAFSSAYIQSVPGVRVIILGFNSRADAKSKSYIHMGPIYTVQELWDFKVQWVKRREERGALCIFEIYVSCTVTDLPFNTQASCSKCSSAWIHFLTRVTKELVILGTTAALLIVLAVPRIHWSSSSPPLGVSQDTLPISVKTRSWSAKDNLSFEWSRRISVLKLSAGSNVSLGFLGCISS